MRVIDAPIDGVSMTGVGVYNESVRGVLRTAERRSGRRASRRLVLRGYRALWLGDEPVADAANGHQVLGFGRVRLDESAQPGNEVVDRTGVGV